MTAITDMVSFEKDGDVAVLRINNPPVNALSHGVRKGLLEGMKMAEADDEVKAVVIHCEGRTFIAGADISEFGKPMKEPGLKETQDAIEESTKPVVAAIHGTALGGGLEIAMTCHYRLGNSKAQYGQPEVKLGLLPGAGGTQRLPRITGVQKALEMCVIGNPIGSAEALETGLIDELVEDADPQVLLEAAKAFARRAVAEDWPLKKVRDRDEKLADAKENPQIFDDFRRKIARKTRGFMAPEYNIRCIEAAVELPFDKGLEREQALFIELMSSLQSQAQRYYFFAERQANKVPDIGKDTPIREIRKVGVLGAGTMGGGIAMNFANAGIPVVIVERDQAAIDKGLGVVRKNYERTAKRGRISMEDVDKRMELLQPALDKDAFADVDIVIEAVFEDMDLKKSIFAELDGICRDGAILATNTSALDVNEIAAMTKRPEDVIGLHFFSPANIMRLLEMVRATKTGQDVVATCLKLSKAIGKIPVVVGVCPGFVGNRMLFQRGIEANQLILEGASPYQVDQVIYDFGFPMGPFAMSDLAGLDIGWKEETSSSSTVREILCESGRRGQKNGRGYYVYDSETRASAPDQEVLDIIADFAKKKGIEQREVSDDEIRDRCLLPMVNEGCKILEEGKAMRASDIDVVWVNGYGWPVYRGGPMFWAESEGLGNIAEKIKGFSGSIGGDHWTISPLLESLVADGKGFGQLEPQTIR